MNLNTNKNYNGDKSNGRSLRLNTKLIKFLNFLNFSYLFLRLYSCLFILYWDKENKIKIIIY
jgi:hypothetical protein